MQEITLEELYEVMISNNLWVTDCDGARDIYDTKEAVSELLTDLKELWYKIVKE